MARKQKKLTRKQRNEQRQAAAAHRRREKGWVSPNEKAKQRAELTEDMAPLRAMLQEGTESEQMEQLFWLLADSAELADEPELEEILLPPIEAAETFAQVGMELGLDPDDLTEMPEEDRDEKQVAMLEMTTRRLLTDELRQEIITALDQLRQRLKREGQKAETAKAAAIQSFLSERKTRDLWPMLGLTQEIVRRSLEVGVELMAASLEVEQLDQSDGDGASESLMERFSQSSIGQKITGLLQKTPGLNKFLEKQADKIWDEGMDAVFNGELDLALYTLEEIEAGMMMLQTLAGDDAADEADPQPERQLTEENIMAFIGQLDAYLTERLTPERVEQSRARLQTMLQEEDYPLEYTAFIHMVADNMADTEAAEYEKPFLLHAFIGEIRATASAIDEYEDDDEDEDE
ncbi:MAG: hypothetical protein HYR94_04085 [Chloroflexi bacterium]|nr:hypothetical protein [Chloroflexota bacterium]